MAVQTHWSHAVEALAEARRRVEAGRAYSRTPPPDRQPAPDRRRATAGRWSPPPPEGGPGRRLEDRPRLRLVGVPEALPAGPAAPRAVPAIDVIDPLPQAPAVIDPVDPRWVLAVRTTDSLQGAVLPPERREALIRLGRTLGLTPFEANLVIAIVQDQARRGVRPEMLTTAAEPDLRMVPRSGAAAEARASRWRVAFLVVAGLAAELGTLWWWLG